MNLCAWRASVSIDLSHLRVWTSVSDDLMPNILNHSFFSLSINFALCFALTVMCAKNICPPTWCGCLNSKRLESNSENPLRFQWNDEMVLSVLQMSTNRLLVDVHGASGKETETTILWKCVLLDFVFNAHWRPNTHTPTIFIVNPL